MKKLMITAAALMIAVAAYGQGQFLFNTHDTGGGNVLTFVDSAGNKIANPNYFLQVLEGPDANHLSPVVGDQGVFTINKTLSSGAASGFTSPFSSIYTIPGSPKNTTVTVGYQAYSGASWAAGTKLMPAPLTAQVTLTEPPATPAEVPLGNQTITVSIPEPATLALGLLGVGALLALRRRQ